jgi:flagellar biosynthesis protein FliQ
MNEIDALDMLRSALWTVLVVSAPGVLAAMVIGLAIALLQALTQVQEMTLTFVPKIIAIFVAIVFAAPMMGAELQSLTNLVFARIESGF